MPNIASSQGMCSPVRRTAVNALPTRCPNRSNRPKLEPTRPHESCGKRAGVCASPRSIGVDRRFPITAPCPCRESSGNSLGSLTGAVEAAVVRAGPVRAGHLFPQRVARAEGPYPRIVRGDPGRVGVVLDRDLVDLYPSEGICVLRLERVGELQDATASDPR